MSDQMDKAAASRTEAEAKGQGLGKVNTSGGFGAGAGGGFGLNKPGFGPEVTHFAKRATIGTKSIDIPEDIHNTWLKVLDDESPLGWVIAVYSASGKALELKASGEGGLSEFKQSLPEDQIAWGGLRCYGVDKRGSVECKRAKFMFVQWFPSTVGTVKKGKAGPHKGEVGAAIGGTHVDLRAESLDDFAVTDLIKTLQAATGAHKPNGYEFDEGVFIEADYYGLGIGKDCQGETSKAQAPQRKSVTMLTADDEDRQLHQKRASNMADVEQMRRVAEIEHADHDAKMERKLTQDLASVAMDAEQERRVEEDKQAPRKSASFVPDLGELGAKLEEKEVKTDAGYPA